MFPHSEFLLNLVRHGATAQISFEDSDSNMIVSARSFAIAAHGEQTYGSHPYVHHLDAVAELVYPYGVDAVVTAYLHDMVEDTDTTLADIESQFGKKVSDWVGLLSDEPGVNRKERKTKTYAKLAAIKGENEGALVVKVADRLANLQSCILEGNSKLWKMYANEHQAFFVATFRRGLCDDLWDKMSLAINAENPQSIQVQSHQDGASSL